MIAPTKLFDLSVGSASGDCLDESTLEVTGELLNELCTAIDLQVRLRKSRGCEGITPNSLMIAQLNNLRRFLGDLEDDRLGRPLSDDGGPMTKQQAIQLARYYKTEEPGLHKFQPIPFRHGLAWKVRVFVTEMFSFDAVSPRDLDLRLRAVFTEAWQ